MTINGGQALSFFSPGGGTTISMQRRQFDARFATRYFVGAGIDVGCGPDTIGRYHQFFPLMTSVMNFDKPGNAQTLEGVDDTSFDFLYSSHCLEHLHDVYEAIRNWIRVVKSGGHLIIDVPDEDLYEQRRWPSTFNPDHKVTFTICKQVSWSTVSINVTDILKYVSSMAKTISVMSIDHAYRFDGPRADQTLTQLTEAAIEIILRKY